MSLDFNGLDFAIRMDCIRYRNIESDSCLSNLFLDQVRESFHCFLLLHLVIGYFPWQLVLHFVWKGMTFL